MDQFHADRMRNAYALLPDNRHLCYQGCSDCCHDIQLTRAEFLYILDGLGGKAPKLSENGACEFLQDGLCAVYERRPWICRVYEPRKDKCGFCPTEKTGKDAALEIRGINKSIGLGTDFVPLKELIGTLAQPI